MTSDERTPPTETAQVRIDDGVLHIPISTDAPGNPLDSGSISRGADAIEALASSDSSVGAILLVGQSNFCAGGDVSSFASAPDRGKLVGASAEGFHRFVRALAETKIPIVAGVHGWAAGAGMSIVCHVDIAIGGRSTKLRPAYPAIGYTPDGGMTWTLPRIVGIARAREILLGNTVIGADDAVRMGILSRVVDDDDVESEAASFAQSIAAGPTGCYAGIKKLLRASVHNSLAEQLDAEALSISAAADSPDGREGVDAFVGKRRPLFS